MEAVDATMAPTRIGATLIARFEELDFRATPMGDLFLRRRRETTLDIDVRGTRVPASIVRLPFYKREK